VWGWYEWRRSLVLRCEPNAGHRAIAALAQRVPRLTLITQNVDGLHQRAGSHAVLELHGSLHQPRCHVCRRAHALTEHPLELPEGGCRLQPPICSECGGLIRPGVVWFGEPLPIDSWRAAQRAVDECDLLLTVGTSGLVHPAAGLPQMAAQDGIPVVQINPVATNLDDLMTLNLRDTAARVLPELVTQAWPESETP
jgi:NAD-dependent deacetylase